ncbi:MAG: bifunctional phosphopantothenoylcysteine decarboxylase/phosphopantothenate--cysteine ligase CoaBC [Candidatus Aminicenantales bacterium]
MRKIALGVCSSVSIYKACEILRGFQKQSCDVQVIMTRNATRLISPLLFRSLSGHKVLVDLFDEQTEEQVVHIDLARSVCLFVVAPATANIIGKFASGVADDFLSTFYLAVKAPVLMAPAMHETMYLHPQTQDNLRKLRARGVVFVDPEKGALASRDKGWGRLAEPGKIVSEGVRLIEKRQAFKGRAFLITAGPTREYLDPVRFLSNPSSGRMGFALAEEALRRGARVILVSGPTHLIPPPEARTRWVQTSEEMSREVERWFPKADVVLMAAAVSDFRFADVSSEKIKKKSASRSVRLVPAPDILKNLGQRKDHRILVGFAAETENLIENARKKLRDKNLDLVVANDVSGRDSGFASEYNRVMLVDEGEKPVRSGKKTKAEISRMILDWIEERIGRTTESDSG